MAKIRSAAPRAVKAQAAKPKSSKGAEPYVHPDKTSLMRPDVGTQPQFRKKKPPKTYRYDSSLSPALDWDGQNGAREQGESAIRQVQDGASELSKAVDSLKASAKNLPAEPEAVLRSAVARVQSGADKLRALGRPFLNWAGKAERLSFNVPTLPLFVHERLSTKAIVETLVGHKTDKQIDLYELFGDPKHSIVDQTLRAYEYQDKWVNRMILGDSLVAMNSLLQYEGLGGQVQMIYIDPPYGVKFGSNFQPFVRKRDVSHNDDEDLTREPEMVKAYRDTWELGLHSYLTYMRDRLLLARDLLAPSGSVFVQIGDENVHHVKELLDETFGASNFVALTTFRKKGMPLGSEFLEGTVDYLLWYARDKERLYFQRLFSQKVTAGDPHWDRVELSDGTRRKMSRDEIDDPSLLPPGASTYQLHQLYPAGVNASGLFPFEFEQKLYEPPPGRSWKTNREGMKRLAAARRLEPYAGGQTLRYVLKLSDYPVSPFNNLWDDLGAAMDVVYVVQTNTEVVKRCVLMSTRPGDLVLDPTCGSGTTAYVAEQWGRRWITIDTSRVPLALSRQRLLTATFPYYQLKEEKRGPAGGFVYVRKQNKKGEEVGGIVPHVTLKSIANNEPPEEEVIVDRPEVDNKFVRVTGPFAFEATIPTPVDWEGDGVEDSGSEQAQSYGSFVDRMTEVLRRSPVLHVGAGKTVNLGNIRQPAKSLSLSAEAIALNGASGRSKDLHYTSGDQIGDGKPVAFVFGPENGAVSERLVHGALQEANLKRYSHLYVIGFAIQPNARQLIDGSAQMGLLPATYVQATPDLMMGDLLKNMRSSQIFSVCGLPEIALHPAKPETKDAPPRFQAELIGLDTFDPTTMVTDHRSGNDVPAWFLDIDYNNLCFHVSQAFFPRTGAWSDLRKALKGDYDDSVWDHLAGTKSAPFEAGEHRQIAVKVIDDRGNELLVVKTLP